MLSMVAKAEPPWTACEPGSNKLKPMSEKVSVEASGRSKVRVLKSEAGILSSIPIPRGGDGRVQFAIVDPPGMYSVTRYDLSLLSEV